MQKRVLFITMLCLVYGLLSAYHNQSMCLSTPSMLSDFQGEVNFAHRFYGQFNSDPIGTFFGMNQGTNANLAYRQQIKYGLEARAGYTSSKNQYSGGVGWSFMPKDFPVQGQIDLSFSSLDNTGAEGRASSLCGMLSLQSEPLLDRVLITANAGYNTYFERISLGAGLNVLLSDKLSLLGEYYPLITRESGSEPAQMLMGNTSAYAVGARLDTWGHTFVLSLSNADHFTTDRMSLGAYTKGQLHLGFNIKRRINF